MASIHGRTRKAIAGAVSAAALMAAIGSATAAASDAGAQPEGTVSSKQLAGKGHARTSRALPPKRLRANLPKRKRGSGARAAAVSYSFYLRTPTSGTCIAGWNPSIGGAYKQFSIQPPIVYALDHSSQYVYWRTVIWRMSDGVARASSTWEQAIAYSNSAAPFRGPATITLTGPTAAPTMAAQTEVAWYSPAYGWHYAYAGKQALAVKGVYGWYPAWGC